MTVQAKDLTGRCENCGAQADDLVDVDGVLLCPTIDRCDLRLYHEQVQADLEEIGEM